MDKVGNVAFGQPAAARGSTPGPAAAAGGPDEIARAFGDAYALLDRRITALLALPWDTDPEAARRALAGTAL